jgi:diguanylate cyclase (GGDEF)-like protein
MIGSTHPERGPFVVYAAILCAGGVLLTLPGADEAAALIPRHAVPVALLAILIGLAWRFPFSILPRARMSMDLVYLIAALAVLPRPLPYVVGAGAAVLGLLLRRGESPGHRPGVALAAFNAGALLLTLGAGSYTTWLLREHWTFHDLTWRNALAVVLVLGVLNTMNLGLLAAAVRLRGGSAAGFAKHHLRYISPLEIFAVPLVISLISLYYNSGLFEFLCLASSLLLVSWLLHHLNRVEEGIRRANQSLQERTSELAALNAIGKEVSSSLDPALVCSVVARHCRKVLPGGVFFVAVTDPDRGDTALRYVEQQGELVAVAPEEKLPVGPGFLEWVLKTQRPLLIRDIFEEGRTLPFPPVVHDPTIRSILMVPLLVDKKGTGVMGLVDPRIGRYDIDRLSVFTTIAQQAAVAIENARHYQLATVDQLTELYLRHHFLQRLADERTRSQRYRSPFAVLMLDLDTFKEINDRHGHATGDRFLKAAAGAIRANLRGSDIACRWGGDEFCVLLPQTDVEAAVATAERIRRGIEALAASLPGAKSSASVGIATYPTDFDGDVKDLVRRADLALYRAKREGRDRVAVYSRMQTPEPAAAGAGDLTPRSG